MMKNILKGFASLFDWMMPKTMEEQLNDLDDSMQRLYDRMGWGKYSYPNINCSYVSGHDIDRVLEAEENFNNYLDDYIYNCRLIKKNKVYKDPARPRTKIYTRNYYL